MKPEKIILFGSYSRGDNKEGSDFDLAVIQKQKPELGQRARVYRRLWDSGYKWVVEPDIHLFSKENFEERLKNNSFFIREVMKGKVIYG